MLESFLQHLQVEGKSPRTLEAYQRDLIGWQRFCQTAYGLDVLENPAAWQLVRPSMLRAWLSTFNNPTTRARKITVLKRFDQFVKSALGGKGLSFRLERPSLPPSFPKAINETALQPHLANLDQAGEDFVSLRDRVLIELLYGLGLRCSEAVELEVSAIHFEQRQIHVLGKGQRWRVLPLYPYLSALLSRYLAERAQLGPTHTRLLCTPKGKPLYRRAAYRIVRAHLGTHPHALRHSIATHLLKRGLSVEAVRDMLGHSSLATTQKYLAISISQLKDAYKKYHPRS